MIPRKALSRRALLIVLVAASVVQGAACRRETTRTREPAGEPRSTATTSGTSGSSETAASTGARGASTGSTPSEDSLDAIEHLEEAPDEVVAMPSPLRAVAPPAHGCALASAAPTRIAPLAGPPTIVADDGIAVVAHYAPVPGGEELVVSSLQPGRAAQPLARVRLSKPRPSPTRVPPGLGVVGSHRVGVAWVDGDDAMSFAVFSTNGTARPRPAAVIARNVDARFPPAIAALGRTTLVAWVAKGATPHTMVAAFEDTGSIRTHDVTPASGGATAPIFADGSTSPVLVVVDPREGFSPISRIGFDEGGVPREAVVIRPVTSLFDPARIAVAEARGDLEIAYAAHASGLATAIGYVRGAPTAPSPVSLVRPTGFGALWVDAASAPTGAVFAALAPLGREATSPRELRVRLADAEGLGPELAYGRGVAFPSVATVSPGLYGIAYASPSAVEAIFVRCSTIVIPTF